MTWPPALALAAVLGGAAPSAACRGSPATEEPSAVETTAEGEGPGPGREEAAGVAGAGGGGAPGAARGGAPGAAAPGADGAADRGEVPGIPGREAEAGPASPDTSIRTARLRLRNATPEGLVVAASAGAAEVPLDTLAAGDSALVEVRVRSDSLLLRALAPDGSERARTWIRLGPAGARRWEIR